LLFPYTQVSACCGPRRRARVCQLLKLLDLAPEVLADLDDGVGPVPSEHKLRKLAGVRPVEKQVDFPLDRRPTTLAVAVDREGVLGPVGQSPDLQQREEAVAVEHGAMPSPTRMVLDIAGTGA